MGQGFYEDPDLQKNFENVFNERTLRALYRLADEDHFQTLHGFAKLGKESNVCVAETDDGTMLAAKIYMVESGAYRDMRKYLLQDPRFQGIKNQRRDIVFAWCRKEFKNLKKAERCGLHAPSPVAFDENVLLMEFLGEGMNPSPRLSEVRLEEPEREFDAIIEEIRTLWQEEDLVHGDLSEYNLLWHGRPYLIDFSQAVLEAHPLADELLERDIENLVNHFQKEYSLDRDPEDVVDRIRE